MGAIPSSLSVMIPHFVLGVNVNQVKFTVNGKICQGTKQKCIVNNKSDTNLYQKLSGHIVNAVADTKQYERIPKYTTVSFGISSYHSCNLSYIFVSRHSTFTHRRAIEPIAPNKYHKNPTFCPFG